MTSKEKALELYNKCLPYVNDYTHPEPAAKGLSMITVNEIVEVLSKDINPLVNYWFEVKQEIKKL